MKLVIGFILGAVVMSGISIAQDWADEPQVLIPIPLYPAYAPPPVQWPYYLPPMPQPSWEHVSPC